MSDKSFKLPPLSPLIGSSLRHYQKACKQGHIIGKFKPKYIITWLIIAILTPFRWWERWKFRNIRSTRLKTPIFILGHWRSGTTHLHNVLCQTPGTGFLSTYQTVFTQYLASRKLLSPLMRLLMPSKRPSDNVKLNVNYPQEDEFALSNITLMSYYHFFYFPKKHQEFFDRNIVFNQGEEMKWFEAYDQLLKKAQSTMPESRHLVIKNPVNTGRLRSLQKFYPEAKFIHIYRNPFVVFLSTKKFFIELLPTLWLEPISEQEIEQMIITIYTRLMDEYYDPRQDRSLVYELKFEDFEQNNLEHIRHIYEALQIDDFDADRPYFEAYINEQKSYRKNIYSITAREVELVRQHWGKYLDKWNYDIPDNMKIEPV